MMIHGVRSISIRCWHLKWSIRKLSGRLILTVAIDCINSVGGIIIPGLLKALGVSKIVELNTTPDGNFAHNPEPLPENLRISRTLL